MGHFKDMAIQRMEEGGYYCPACGTQLIIGLRHSCSNELTDVSLQEASYRLWLAENDLETGYGSIGDMAWDEPEAARLLREEQRVRLQAMSPEQYNEWLTAQEEEMLHRYDCGNRN
jgi:hypothetical protein